ncbi:hypothetical protein K1T71_010735 [Dendrolimus kikuchii]|uniref:Uncharacterized protein n=1 Tax=Dendrolimus kikuchii TaxID=765133 RepID=A0ACC1CQ46_9NEOP|nr:hypothetical protein K1T71_010735 [Dendrolimus kikuchii]
MIKLLNMGLIMGIVKRLIKLLVYFTIFAAIVVLIPNLPPYTTFSSIKLDPTQPRSGPLAPNGVLNNAKQVYKEKLLGPESFEIFNGELYTSLATGEIVKISPGGHVTFVTKLGQPCTGLTQEHICGRPLGFQIDEKTNTLYVADAYFGIWKVNLKTDKKQLLVSPNVAIDGKVPKLFNSVIIGNNGDLYWTDSTTDFHLKDGAISMLTDPSGRFFHYNAAKNESKVLLDKLWFANGLAISPDGQFVLISESNRYRVIKYYIDGPNKGKSGIFVSGLPGVPDNLRTLPDGSGVLVSLYTVFDEDNPLLSRTMSETPVVRKFLARIQKLIEIPFEYLHNLYPHIILEEIVYHIGHFNSVSRFVSGMSGLVHMDWNGNIIASYYNSDGSLGHVSDAIVYGDKLYTGCPHKQNFIGSVPAPPLLLKAFSAKKPQATKDTKPVQKEDKPKQEVPKVTKPVAAEPPKQKPIEKPKLVTEKPIDKPKPVTEKPVVKPKPITERPVEKLKPVTEKPVEKPKPVEKKIETPKTTTPKPTQQPPKATQDPKVEPKVTTPEPKKTSPPPTTAPPKQENKPTTPKPATKPMKMETKPAESTTAKPAPKVETKPVKESKPETAQKPVKDAPKAPEQIPIKEEIPSDTAKPTKEKLKVIKKGGPTEIPNINNV